MIISTDLRDGQDVVYQISEAVTAQTDTEISALPPLYETIDPDALDVFLNCSNGAESQTEWSVEFPYCGYEVTVDSTGELRLQQERESISSTPDT